MAKKERNIILKNGKQVKLQSNQIDYENRHIIKAINDNGDNVGYLIFKIQEDKVCYLIKIEIVDSNYSHQGLGTAMLRFMERLASEQYCRYVDGRFFPCGSLGKFAKDFYIKNGYKINEEYYDKCISKQINIVADIDISI